MIAMFCTFEFLVGLPTLCVDSGVIGPGKMFSRLYLSRLLVWGWFGTYMLLHGCGSRRLVGEIMLVRSAAFRGSQSCLLTLVTVALQICLGGSN
jgi:hypothetical protein